MVNSVVKDAVGETSVVGSVEPVCYKYVADFARAADVKTLEVMDHCAEMKGRVAEAEEGGYLKDGSEVCASIVRDDAAETSADLETYLPMETDPTEHREAFCLAFVAEVDACKEEVTTTSTLAPSTSTIPFAPAPPRSEWDTLQSFGEGESADPPPPVALLSLRHHRSNALSLLDVSGLR
jgi:hypothetical protein